MFQQQQQPQFAPASPSMAFPLPQSHPQAFAPLQQPNVYQPQPATHPFPFQQHDQTSNGFLHHPQLKRKSSPSSEDDSSVANSEPDDRDNYISPPHQRRKLSQSPTENLLQPTNTFIPNPQFTTNAAASSSSTPFVAEHRGVRRRRRRSSSSSSSSSIESDANNLNSSQFDAGSNKPGRSYNPHKRPRRSLTKRFSGMGFETPDVITPSGIEFPASALDDEDEIEEIPRDWGDEDGGVIFELLPDEKQSTSKELAKYRGTNKGNEKDPPNYIFLGKPTANFEYDFSSPGLANGLPPNFGRTAPERGLIVYRSPPNPTPQSVPAPSSNFAFRSPYPKITTPGGSLEMDVESNDYGWGESESAGSGAFNDEDRFEEIVDEQPPPQEAIQEEDGGGMDVD